jgi:transposase
MVAELGTDMSRLPTPGHLASWAGRCPGNDQSAGKRRSGHTRKGSKWLRIALEESSLAATRTNDSYLHPSTSGSDRESATAALVAVQHSMLVAYWHMFTTDETYRDLGGDYFRKRDPERQTRRLVAQLQALGHQVTLQPAA